jgi:prepilin-type N-terminal cleavage/methylation domain-containing protein
MRGVRHSAIRRRGFSLIEVVFAIFLVATGAAVVVATMPIANSSRAKADLNNKAVGLAQKQLEAIRGLGYANLTPAQLYSYGLIDSTTPISTNTYACTNSDYSSYDSPSRVLPTGMGWVKVEQVDLDLRQVTVSISYNERGKTRTYTLGTLVANL